MMCLVASFQSPLLAVDHITADDDLPNAAGVVRESGLAEGTLGTADAGA